MICAIHNAKKVSNTKSTRTVFAHFYLFFPQKAILLLSVFLHKLSHFSAFSLSVIDHFRNILTFKRAVFHGFAVLFFIYSRGYFIPPTLSFFLKLHFLTWLSFYHEKFQIVSFAVVKKSDGASRECSSKSSVCCQLVKTQGFFGFVCCW